MEGGVDIDTIGIAEQEGITVKFSDGEYADGAALFTYDGDIVFIGIA